MTKKIKYVQLEPAEVLLDFHTSRMTAEQFGCYWLIVLHLYCSGGRVEFDIEMLKSACNCPQDFETIFKRIESKFQKSKGFLRHKRVSFELRKAKQRVQAARQKGLKGAKARWHKHSTDNGTNIAKESKGNVIEEMESKQSRIRNSLSDSPLHSLVSSTPLRHGGNPTLASAMLGFNDSLRQIIRPRNQSDRTSFRNIGNWLLVKMQAGEFTEEILPRVLDYAAEAVKGRSRNPAAVFTSILKRELNYRP